VRQISLLSQSRDTFRDMKSAVLNKAEINGEHVRVAAKLMPGGSLLVTRRNTTAEEATGILIAAKDVPTVSGLLEHHLDEPDLPLLRLLRWAFERAAFGTYEDLRDWLRANGINGETMSWHS